MAPNEGTLWVADFVDGEGVLVEPAHWVRFTLPAAPRTDAEQRTMTAESGPPLTPALVRGIFQLLHTGAATRTPTEERAIEPPFAAWNPPRSIAPPRGAT